jgi:phosphoesterase RecJ-like protein
MTKAASVGGFEEVVAVFHEHERFAVTSHIGPEADAIGALLAVAAILKGMGKRVWPVMRDSVPDNLKFLPGAGEIRSPNEVPHEQIEAWVVVDCGQLNRVGESFLPLIEPHPLIVNIDHHQDNPRFGHVNWVVPLSSTTMLLYELAQQLGIEISPDLATCLYAGIVADTDSFRNTNVTPDTLRVAADLLEKGARAREISVNLYERRSPAELKLMGHTLLSARMEEGIIWSSIPQEIFRETGGGLDDTERLAEELRAADGVEVAVLFKELPTGKIKVSLRTKDTDGQGLDVSRIARVFGGGGHRQAAGCLIPGRLEEVEAAVLAEVRRALEDHERRTVRERDRAIRQAEAQTQSTQR